MGLLPPRANQNDLKNIFTESFLYDRFKMLMINQFKWNGLEELGIQERHIEEWLFSEGHCLFFEDKEMGLMALRCYGTGKLNVVGEHVKYRATGFGYSKVYKEDECVLIENNKLRMPTEKAVLYFVMQLYRLVRTKDMNVEQLRLQSLFVGNDKNILTLKKIIDELDNYNWAIVTDAQSIDVESIVKAVPTGVKPLTKELRDEYNCTMNEALTYFGINNANTDKRERLITDEANANNQLIDCCAQMFLESRQRACKEINKKFGTNISVELRNKREEKEVNEDDKSNEKTDSE